MSEDNKEKIKVTDKRKFDSKGNPRKSQKDSAKAGSGKKTAREQADKKKTAKPPESEKKSEQESATETKTGSKAEGGGTADSRQEVAIDFSTFVYSLGTQAMMALGLLPDPITDKKEPNLEGARQLIDIIVMLREKTRGNLDGQEITLIDNLLFELRMRYVELTKNREQS